MDKKGQTTYKKYTKLDCFYFTLLKNAPVRTWAINAYQVR